MTLSLQTRHGAVGLAQQTPSTFNGCQAATRQKLYVIDNVSLALLTLPDQTFPERSRLSTALDRHSHVCMQTFTYRPYPHGHCLGVTRDLDKTCRHPTLSMLWNPHDQISLLHDPASSIDSDLHKSIPPRNRCATAINSDLVETWVLSAFHSGRIEYTKSIMVTSQFSFRPKSERNYTCTAEQYSMLVHKLPWYHLSSPQCMYGRKHPLAPSIFWSSRKSSTQGFPLWRNPRASR
jgi:hypothetical protein